jgi:HTH-type transcriptional regulator/antitoxin HigA
MALRRRTPAQDAYLDLLSTLVEAWEARNVDIPPNSPIEVVKFMCEMHGLPQRALVPIFGTDSIVSEVLNGKRELQRKHIAGLASFFNVSPAVFFQDERRQSPPNGASDGKSSGRRRLARAAG